MATTIVPKSKDTPVDTTNKNFLESKKKSRSSKDLVFDYKRPETLRSFVSETGRIVPARISRLTSKQQRELTREIKKSRALALLPYSDNHYKH